ncbi:MAG: hypothetical protein ACD_9C00301G0005 [uncultured bacterium]|nr:MAG: hypothetical protein ACD_9C00301G0005 [uncultured bacterium]
MRIIPKKLKKGDHIRIIAPARSMGIISENSKLAAIERLEKFGFTLSFGKHVNEMDEFNSSSVSARLEDLHEAFADESVDAIFTVIGGYNTNQLLNLIDYELITKNPKIFCGFSDITAICNTITAKTGMVTYMGPHFSSWAMKYGFEYSIEYIQKCCFNNESFDIVPSVEWSDDPWYIDQEKRQFISNDGYWIINSGKASGKLIGGHVRCLNALQGTNFWPGLKDSILIMEEDAEINPSLFDRQLQSLIHQSDFSGVRGIIIGRFQKEAKMTRDILDKIISSKPELKNIPIIANADFGHTTPIATLPIGGEINMAALKGEAEIIVTIH